MQLQRDWLIRRPVIYRYLDKRFVDAFFETGALRLSSFAAFSKHKDEERQDSLEGHGSVVHRNSEGSGQTVFALTAQGHSAFVLCGAMNYQTDLAESFKTDSGFRINDSLGFGDAISKYIPGFQLGMEGPCLYLGKKLVVRDMGPVDLHAVKGAQTGEEVAVGKLFQTVAAAAGNDLMFLKSATYAHQNEYRLLWHSPHVVSDYIDIVCPEAIQFCTRFEDMLAERPDGDRGAA
ncbi:hypothetical protein PFX98_19770 [Paucibacter sediminis]|uniref:Uncharacterized protein n=1 Tax=Paucibacter sediminis TaxID=3019553 RepID=A0AA95SV37_9BURK|nr:hypothetical protein [Paucibacter sp. S2-9]WIT11119.1 hypothetical protein PFX98_19770 [Paucibacter sp. S2-9]